MTFLGSEFIVKELSSQDHFALCSVARSYFDHVSKGASLLAAIYLHFEDLSTGRKFYVMRNVLGSGPFLAKYDLKGCNDDKTIELFGKKIGAARLLITSAGRWCGYAGPQDLCAYTAGKWAAARADLVVTEKQREHVLEIMQRDTDWLASMSLMDYSLIVGVKTGPEGFASTPDDVSGLGCQRFVRGCSDGSQVAVCVGIIDFLQLWTLKKMCARVVKCMECNKATIPPAAYATRFCNHFEDRFVAAKSSASTPSIIGKNICPVVEAAEGGGDNDLEDAKLTKIAPAASEASEQGDSILGNSGSHTGRYAQQEKDALLDSQTN
jgi:hypothetical protein